MEIKMVQRKSTANFIFNNDMSHRRFQDPTRRPPCWFLGVFPKRKPANLEHMSVEPLERCFRPIGSAFICKWNDGRWLIALLTAPDPSQLIELQAFELKQNLCHLLRNFW